MRFGDSRVQALAGALCQTLCAVTGITNRSLRALMTGLLGAPYTMAQASYDLARLRRNCLITRRPHANTYDLTPEDLILATSLLSRPLPGLAPSRVSLSTDDGGWDRLARRQIDLMINGLGPAAPR